VSQSATAPTVTDGGIVHIAVPSEARNVRLVVQLHMRSAERFDALAARHDAQPREHRTEGGLDFRAASFETGGQAWKAFGPPSGQEEPGEDALVAELIEEPAT
jgi:hypothetical protein